MFAISQFVLKSLKVCNTSSLPSYSIALGILFYASLYVYLLYYQNDYIYIFNKFVIYVIGIDLLLSAFLYFKPDNNQLTQPNSSQLSLSTDFEDNENVTLLNNDQDQESDYSESGYETESFEEFGQDPDPDHAQEIQIPISNIVGLEQQLNDLLRVEEQPPQESTVQATTVQATTVQESNIPQQSQTNTNINTVEAEGEAEGECEIEAETELDKLTDLQSEQPKRKRGRPPKNQNVQIL
uniref:Transmembrane protein n=1 Tax=viral metagenome TaxID=1070528 RepID=A0A6C0H6T2_9ZZZZ